MFFFFLFIVSWGSKVNSVYRVGLGCAGKVWSLSVVDCYVSGVMFTGNMCWAMVRMEMIGAMRFGIVLVLSLVGSTLLLMLKF